MYIYFHTVASKQNIKKGPAYVEELRKVLVFKEIIEIIKQQIIVEKPCVLAVVWSASLKEKVHQNAHQCRKKA